ncbi:diguanylate cyclase with GGDEF domain [Tahibacter aquaticus]|uniref:Diguanylate cyclase with GGDEF domain n=1 Tax=Tahibacter aquaticus TaxID=520092 RepID=A0A4R6Z9J0_9GAMM|nr:EAL domain-containing protein [Tahibacter aquaticus]TDR48588.1 diguanylate cyclase with GGDEF domain [Tahibacter aquaticus]
MSNHGNIRTDGAARDELRQRCLSLVRRWQPLAQGGWDRNAARQLGDELDQIGDTSERLGLDKLNNDALELAAYLCSFIDDALLPNTRDLARLAQMVEALGADLTDLSATTKAAVHTLPSARISAEMPVVRTASLPPARVAEKEIVENIAQPPQQAEASAATPAAEPLAAVVPVLPPAPATDFSALLATPPAAAALVRPTPPTATASPPLTSGNDGLMRLPRLIALHGIDDSIAPGLISALRERGFDTRVSSEADDLIDFLGNAVPGALILDARKLRVYGRVRAIYDKLAADGEALPSLIVVSPDADLGHRLLAMRAGAAGFFQSPVDSLRVLAKLDELLAHTAAPAWRVLLVAPDRNNAVDAARALAERGMTARIVGNGQGTLAALAEFRPDVVVLDCNLPDVGGIELTQMIRQQPEYAAVPIILAADASAVNLRFDAIAAGGDEFLVKPLKTRHLLSAVTSRVRRAHWLREVIGNPDGRDSRTGLYSRTVIIEKLSAALGDRSAALLTVAIDRAGELREKIGLTGLAAIDAHVGNLLRTQLDEVDLPAQFTDFHYFVMLHRRSRNDITDIAERLRFALATHPFIYQGQSHPLTTSIGMALLGGEHASVDEVVTNAEAAQIAAAHLGGNRVLWFEAKEAALLPSDPMLAVRAVLSRPLTPEQTQFEFQPIVALAGKLSGQFELSFKVKSTQQAGVAVAYADLAPVAAECNQLTTLDRWLLERSLSVREEQLKRGRQLRLFVPQSVATLLDPDIPYWLARELKERHLSGTGLTLELNCSELIDAGARASERLKFLHQSGVRVCLVDFGRDWAAVHALKNLTIDFVRLSAGLVSELGTAKSMSDTLLALVRKAHAAGCAVIAPEVDSINRAHLLLRLGVDYGVGPAFARPSGTPEFDFTRPLW